VAQLDIPVRQVLIEARIVEADVGYEKDLGVKWRGLSTNNGNWVVGGTNDDRIIGGSSPGTLVDLGANAATSSLGIGFITDNTILDLELTAMESTGNGEVISQPKVVTSDKETAKILKGKEIPYQEASSSGATTTQFKDAVLSLEVTPQITPDDRVIMEVKVTKDDIDDSVPRINGVPALKTNEVNAKVLVRDGETIVIGGVFTTQQSKTVEKVPFLGDLPYLGQMFKNTRVIDNKTELLVFLTPRIMNGSAITPEQ
jgi:type IV pilus assembly protein PilQ